MLPIKPILAFLSVVLLTQNTVAFSAECSAKTGSKTVPLLALYTSEGCSSCPPADKWLNSIKRDTSEVTPLAFHVDYWNYIGWKDRFSKAEYSDRQRKMAAFSGIGFVYTPQFMFNGRDFRGWGDSRLNSALKQSQNVAARANLSLNAVHEADGSMTVEAIATVVRPEGIKRAEVFVALYENDLTTNVQAGENAGRRLRHDYVVRKLFGPYPIDAENRLRKRFTLGETWAGKDAGAAVFVQDGSNGEIIQSLALDFCS